MVDGVQHPVIWTHGKLLDVGVPTGYASAGLGNRRLLVMQRSAPVAQPHEC